MIRYAAVFFVIAIIAAFFGYGGVGAWAADFGKLFLDWILSDKGQEIFAKFGARPIRYVTGDLKLPDSAKTLWLPDAQYAKVQTVDTSKIDLAKIADIWQNQVGAGG